MNLSVDAQARHQGNQGVACGLREGAFAAFGPTRVEPFEKPIGVSRVGVFQKIKKITKVIQIAAACVVLGDDTAYAAQGLGIRLSCEKSYEEADMMACRGTGCSQG